MFSSGQRLPVIQETSQASGMRLTKSWAAELGDRITNTAMPAGSFLTLLSFSVSFVAVL